MTYATPRPRFAQSSDQDIPLWLVRPDGWNNGNQTIVPVEAARWATQSGFTGSPGAICLVPNGDGSLRGALVGLGPAQTDDRRRFVVGGAAKRLPEGIWKIETDLNSQDAREAALGWLLGQYEFTRYASGKPCNARLVAPDGIDVAQIEAMAAGEFLTRDLINTPASDMGPDALEGAARDLAGHFGARLEVTSGDALLDSNFPMIHAVGRAATQLPRLLDMRWGDAGPCLTLVGKGVCFDTGGLNLKPGASMGLMKKDMGGSATVLGLAQMIMSMHLPLRLRVLIPAVENSVAGNAFRPGDILTARDGQTVEINNTDAEGRLVLADALSFATEEAPDLMISMATLTGAARVAVGPDLAPFYTDGDGMAYALVAGSGLGVDPVWRMPFWSPYEDMIEPGIADLDNAPAGGFAGSITAALFLRRFSGTTPYMHFDIYGWQPKPAPARPKGGVGQGARAILCALPDMLKL